MTSKKEIMTDLKFCKELMDRLVKFADENYQDSVPWGSNRTGIKNDIARLRRELTNVSHKLDV